MVCSYWQNAIGLIDGIFHKNLMTPFFSQFWLIASVEEYENGNVAGLCEEPSLTQM